VDTTPLPAHHPALRALPSRELRARETGDLVHALAADPTFWRDRVRHDPVERWHARLHWSPFAEIYLLGWTPQQDTRMHDHGGSVGAFAVVQGELFEEHTRSQALVTDRRRHHAGDVTAFGARYVHNLGNLGPGVATSIHAYSPPLAFMRFYRPDASGRWQPSYRLAVDGPEPDDSSRPVPIGMGVAS
jgi:predicted metal-dependent enzyme (double-stranded beta helix superfamily)